MTLAILTYLLWQTLANPLETGLHVARSEQLENAAAADAELNRQIFEARLTLDAASAGLDEAGDRFAAATDAVTQGRVGLQGLSPALDEALFRFRRSAGEKLELLEDYAQQQNRLALLFSALRNIAGDALATSAVTDSAALRQDIEGLLREATIYTIRASGDNAAELEQRLAAVALAASRLDETAGRAELSRLIDTVMSLRYTRDELQALLVGLESLPSAGDLAQLRATYQRHFEVLQHVANLHRQTLAVFAVALLFAFGVIAWRLRGSFATLDAVNAQLQHANTNLEQVVAERTEDLSRALHDLRTQQAQLVQSEKMASLGQMVAGVAHEINTPLGYASSNVEMVRESMESLGGELDAETASEFAMLLGDAEYGLRQIGELVMSLKDFSRVDRSRTELFNLNEGIDTALKICQNQLKTGVEVNLDYGALPAVSCAPSQLNQVFLNLINNACQAMDGNGELRIRSWQDEGRVKIAFADTGCGMDEETVAHIFEPFFTTKPVGEGTGLGLSIVFRIIEDHGGLIEVESAPGQGTVITLTLPINGSGDRGQNVVVVDETGVSEPA